MAARSDFPIREGFALDANSEVTTTAKDLGYDLGATGTFRIVVLGATVTPPVGDGDAATIQLQDADDSNAVFYTVTSADLASKADANGVFIDHLRGALYDGIRNVRYVYAAGANNTGTGAAVAGQKVYIDRV